MAGASNSSEVTGALELSGRPSGSSEGQRRGWLFGDISSTAPLNPLRLLALRARAAETSTRRSKTCRSLASLAYPLPRGPLPARTARGHGRARPRQGGAAAAVRVWRARAHLRGAADSTALGPLPLATEARARVDAHRGGAGEAPPGPRATARPAPDVLPWRLRAQPTPAPRGDAGPASAARARRHTFTRRRQAPPPRLGHCAAAHLGRRRLARPPRREVHSLPDGVPLPSPAGGFPR